MLKYFPVFVFLISLLAWGCKHKRDYNGELIVDDPCDQNTVYFQNTILPLLNSRCGFGGCHNSVTHAEGVDVTNYNSIMNSSSENGMFVVYDHPDQSTLYNSIKNGEMPPYPYSPFSSHELELVYNWIDQGAFNNECAVCDTNLFQFGADVFPIFMTRCMGCHGSVSPSGGIPLTNYTEIKTQVINFEIQGVLTDPVNYPVMPPSTGLPSCEKTKILKWITNGALNN